MQTETIQIDRAEARILYRAYRDHCRYGEPIDAEIRRTYLAIARGQVVIKALESVAAAGVDAEGLPKLALMRADAKRARLTMWRDGSATMCEDIWRPKKSATISWPAGTFPTRENSVRDRGAIVPIIPLYLRPKKALSNYHILWEAEWRPIPPHDPLLLRRLGKGDLWLVLAQWDLTEVERAALQTRVNSA